MFIPNPITPSIHIHNITVFPFIPSFPSLPHTIPSFHTPSHPNTCTTSLLSPLFLHPLNYFIPFLPLIHHPIHTHGQHHFYPLYSCILFITSYHSFLSYTIPLPLIPLFSSQLSYIVLNTPHITNPHLSVFIPLFHYYII